MNSSFAPILNIARILQEFPGPWFVSGGWAIDLFLGRVTREHSDIEVGIYRCDQDAIRRHLPDWLLEKAIETPDGGTWVPWGLDEQLCLPVHQIRATRADSGLAEFEFFLNERSGTHWVSRRHRGLTQPITSVEMMSSLGVPILSPEIQLLYKAKYSRPKDQADFECTFPRLNSVQTAWLAAALRDYHPNHPWNETIKAHPPPAAAK